MLAPRIWRFPPAFSFGSFMVLAFTFKSMIYFQLIFGYSVRQEWWFVFPYIHAMIEMLSSLSPRRTRLGLSHCFLAMVQHSFPSEQANNWKKILKFNNLVYWASMEVHAFYPLPLFNLLSIENINSPFGIKPEKKGNELSHLQQCHEVLIFYS